MTARVKALVKPELLVWARQQAGLDLDEAAQKATVSTERLESWEQGNDSPTINQLRTLARVYKRPLAVFYLQQPPADFQVMRDFRRLPGEVASRISPELRHEIRVAYQRRELALDLLRDTGEEPKRFVASASLSDNPETVGGRIRELLGLRYQDQTAWRDPRAGFYAWRTRIEALGVLVFQVSGIELTEMRGFSIAEELAPVIAVNTKDSPSGRSFSLLHEFTHLMLRRSGICDFDEDALRPPEEQRIEVFCNQAAAAALVPMAQLLGEPEVVAQGPRAVEWSDEALNSLSRQYSVSREVILRRFLSAGRTTDDYYRRKRAQFLAEYKARQEREREKASGGGPSPAVSTVSNFGKPFVRLVLSNYYQDRITLRDVAAYLGVRLKHLPKIEEAVITG